MPEPDLSFETECIRAGYQYVAGVDEVGMGCLAGPVVAAAVVLDFDNIPAGINDSKKLSPKERLRLSNEIRLSARAWAIGIAEVEEIDEINIYHAAKRAMVRAVESLSMVPDYLLIDGRGKLECAQPSRFIVKGDSLSVSIGAASIVAKVFRDEMMRQFDIEYPGYGFASHKGYGSHAHRVSLQEKGRTPIHRKSFSWTPV